MRKLLLAILVAACAQVEPPATTTETGYKSPKSNLSVTTDKRRYQLQEGPYGPEVHLVTTFTNRTGKPLYLVNCNGAFSTGLERMIEFDTKFEHAWSTEMNACLSAPIVIGPGESKSERIVAASGAHAAVSPRENSSRIEAGAYRVVWHGLYKSFDMHAKPWGEEVPVEERASAPFDILPLNPNVPHTRPAEITSVEPQHQSTVRDDATIHVSFVFPPATFALRENPRIYVDREDVTDAANLVATEDVPPSQVEIEYKPPRRWKPGKHDIRVVYWDKNHKPHWYAWWFEVRK